MALIVVGAPTGARSAPEAAWEKWLHLPGVLDLGGPLSDGRLVVAVHGHLEYLSSSGSHTPLAKRYAVGKSPESYITVSPGLTVARARCTFPRDTVYVLDLTRKQPGVTAISPQGSVTRLATLAGAARLNAITIDTGQAFDHRLLVVEKSSPTSRVFAVDCRGGVQTIATVNALLEGGIAIAPQPFGSFGGQLIAPDEIHGIIYAIDASGTARVVVHPSIPSGSDIGVESIGFVPPGGLGAAYVADRGTPKSANPHPGTDSILRLSATELKQAGVRSGDLLAASEGAGTTISVRCATRCTWNQIASGPPAGHIEGHILVVACTVADLPLPAKKTFRLSPIWFVAFVVVGAGLLVGLAKFLRRNP